MASALRVSNTLKNIGINYGILLAIMLMMTVVGSIIYNPDGPASNVVTGTINQLKKTVEESENLHMSIFFNNVKILLLELLLIYPLSFLVMAVSMTTTGILIGFISTHNNFNIQNILTLYLLEPFFHIEILSYAVAITATYSIYLSLDKKPSYIRLLRKEYRNNLKNKFLALIHDKRPRDLLDFIMYFFLGISIDSINKEILKHNIKYTITLAIASIAILFTAAILETVLINNIT